MGVDYPLSALKLDPAHRTKCVAAVVGAGIDIAVGVNVCNESAAGIVVKGGSEPPVTAAALIKSVHMNGVFKFTYKIICGVAYTVFGLGEILKNFIHAQQIKAVLSVCTLVGFGLVRMGVCGDGGLDYHGLVFGGEVLYKGIVEPAAYMAALPVDGKVGQHFNGLVADDEDLAVLFVKYAPLKGFGERAA